jgi:hypothetical protein
MKRDKLRVAWGYLVEIVLASLLVILGYLTIGMNAVSGLVHEFAIDFATLYCAVFFAAALGFFWTFYSKADTDFYTWLDDRGAFQVYLHAMEYTLAIEGGAIFTLLATKVYTSQEIALIAAFVFLMAFINSYTMVKNVIALMKLHTLFNRVSRRSGTAQP